MANARVLTAAMICSASWIACQQGSENRDIWPTAPIPATQAVALVGATVLAMDDEPPHADWTVVVRDGRIAALGPRGTTQIPDDAVAVDATNRFVMPGLIDMHVHIRTADLGEYVRFGITTVRNMWGYAELPATIASIDEGKTLGPRILSVSPGVDGPPAKWPQTILEEDAKDARRLVMTLKAAGWIAIKVYDDLQPAVYDSIIAAAADAGIPVVGHVPVRTTVQHVLAAGQRSLEHLRGYDVALAQGADWTAPASLDNSRVIDLARATRAANPWICPTLTIYAFFYKGLGADSIRGVRNRRQLVHAMRDESVRVLIGTDAGIGYVPPGSTFHDEMDEFVRAGYSPADVIRIATHDAADFLGILDDAGTIAVGKRADLVVLAANPLEDIRNTRRISGVMIRGALRSAAAAR